MDSKKVKYAQIAIVVVVVVGIILGLGPLLVGTLMKNFVKISPVRTASMFAKVSGAVSATDSNNMVVITSTDGKKYVIEGDQVPSIRKFNGKYLEVFGRMKRANPAKITVDGKSHAVRFNVFASAFGEKDLKVGEQLSPEALKALAEKSKAHLAFRDEVLAKLGMQNVLYDVVKGTLRVEGYVDTKTLAQCKVLVLTDGNKDRYNLTGDAILPIVDNFGLYKDATVVLVGAFVPNIDGMVSESNVRTLSATYAYFDDLKPIKKIVKQ